jgi:hypothetical protein
VDNFCATKARLPKLSHDTGKGGSDTVAYRLSEAGMAKLVIHDLSPETLQQLEAKAKSLQISVEELAGTLLYQSVRTARPLEDVDVERVMELVKDLADPEIMSGAWH